MTQSPETVYVLVHREKRSIVTIHLHSVPTLRVGAPREIPRIFQGIPAVEVTRAHVWAAWYGGGSDEGVGNYVMLARTPVAEAGGSWPAPYAVVEPDEYSRLFDPELWTDPLGRLWFFVTQSSNPESNWDGRGGVWAIRCDDPVGAPETWGAPRRLCDGVMMNKPIVDSYGRWILPVAIWDFPSRLPEYDGRRLPYAVVSTDDGETFDWAGGAQMPPRTFDEHQIIEHTDGTLSMFVRSSPFALVSESTDGGATWSPGRPSSIPCPDSRFSIIRLQSGAWALTTHLPPAEPRSFAGPQPERSYLAIALSHDEGQTWGRPFSLRVEPRVSYPDVVEREGSLWITYDFNRFSDRLVLLTRLTEEDIEAGEIVSPTSFLNAVVDDGDK